MPNLASKYKLHFTETGDSYYLRRNCQIWRLLSMGVAASLIPKVGRSPPDTNDLWGKTRVLANIEKWAACRNSGYNP
jgi:hypothetical protein